MASGRHGIYDDLSRVRPPQQDRSRRAQRAALDAFEELLAVRPLSKVTVQDVAESAGLSITSVYARFDGKDAMVLALHERVILNGGAQMDAVLGGDAIAEAPLEDVVAALVDGAIAYAQANAHVFRAVLVASDEETNERAAAFIRLGSVRIARALEHRLPPPLTKARRDIDFAWRSVVAVLQQTWSLGGADPGRFPLSNAELSTRLTRQFLAAISHTTAR